MMVEQAENYFVRLDYWEFCREAPVPVDQLDTVQTQREINAGMGWFQCHSFEDPDGHFAWEPKALMQPIKPETFQEASWVGFAATELDLAAWESGVILLGVVSDSLI